MLPSQTGTSEHTPKTHCFFVAGGSFLVSIWSSDGFCHLPLGVSLSCEKCGLGACRISYELSEEPPVVVIKNREGRQERVKVVPDAWLRFDRTDGKKLPILWEIDRGREHQNRFRQHVASRVAFLDSGQYEQVFGQRGARIAYLTTGDRPE